MIPDSECEIFSARGRILVHIASHPDCTIRDLADVLCLTRRSIWGAIGELRRADLVRIPGYGRTNHYRVNLDAPFQSRSVTGHTIRSVLAGIAR